VNLGLLSTARINDAILRGASLTDAVEIVAVGSRDTARANAYAREHRIARAHGSYEELLADPEVDAIYNSLPNSLHVEWSIRALEAGKHVLCEKPLDRSPGEVERLFDVAERHGLVVMEAFMYRHHPQTHALLELVRSGGIGELRQISALFSFTITDPANVRLRPDLAGGSLMDVGCYCVSGSRLLAGEPELVVGRQVLGETGVGMRFDGILQFPGNVLAQFYCGFDLPAASGLEAIGSKGSVLVREPWHCRDPHLEVNGNRIGVPDVDRYQLELENFAAAAGGDAPPLLGRDDAVGQARVIDALYRSAESGSAVPLGTGSGAR
jgi:D-xylose 1-dehydrogenase (NADP+, D-xylono-1,5-lactone-forming)